LRRGEIFLGPDLRCVLAARVIGSGGISFATVPDKLKTHQISTVILPCIDGRVLKIRQAGTPEAQHRELYKLLEVPKTIISPVRTWIGKDENM